MKSRGLFFGMVVCCMLVGSPVPNLLGQVPAPAQGKTRLGVTGVAFESPHDDKYTCVKVTSVLQGSAATRLKRVGGDGTTYYLVANRDFIGMVNDVRVRNFEDLKREIAKSGDYCELQIYDSATKAYAKYYTYLD